MYLNKTEKLLILFILFLNFISINKVQALKRSSIHNKTNSGWINKIFIESKKANINAVDNHLKINPQIYLLSDLNLDGNYSQVNTEDEINEKDTINRDNLIIPKENTQEEFELINKDAKSEELIELNKEDSFNNQDEIEIRSDSQSEEGNNLYANGNVLVIYKSNILNADQIIYNKEKKIINAKGNVIFLIKNDIFQADSINYDFANETGKLVNVKGFINTGVESIDFESSNIDAIPSELLNKLQIEKIIYTPEKIRNWIFKTNEMIIVKNKWFAQQAIISNDLFESEQINFKINKLQIIVEEDILRLKSGLNYLVIEEKVSIPFLLPITTISSKADAELGLEKSINRWNISYDMLDRDGYYIGRKFDPLNLLGDYKLELQPQYFLQRSIKGNSQSFVQKDFSITSDKVKRNTTLADYFGLESKIEGNFGGWNHKIKNNINTFDSQKFSQALRSKVEFSKKINLFNDEWTNQLYWVYRDRVWNGSQGESEIYGGYGWQLEKSRSWNFEGIAKNSYLGLGFGRFMAEELNSKNLGTSFKGSIFYKLAQRFPIFTEDLGKEFIDQSFLYIPKPIQNGIYLDTEFSALSNFYRNGNHQEYLSFGAGPEFIFGEFKSSAFDYTRLRIFPLYTMASGKSFFKFDQSSDQLLLDLNLDQHLIGPVLIKTEGRLNLNSSSSDYGQFINSKISLNWKRRAYEFGIYYQPNRQFGGIQFAIFGFK